MGHKLQPLGQLIDEGAPTLVPNCSHASRVTLRRGAVVAALRQMGEAVGQARGR
jgi:hypothetical protein